MVVFAQPRVDVDVSQPFAGFTRARRPASPRVMGAGDLDGDYAPDLALNCPAASSTARWTRRPRRPRRRVDGPAGGGVDGLDAFGDGEPAVLAGGENRVTIVAGHARLSAQPAVDVPVQRRPRAPALPARAPRRRLARVQPEPGRGPDRALQPRAGVRRAVAHLPADRLPQRQRAHPRPRRRADHGRDRRPRRLLRHAAGRDPAGRPGLLHRLRPRPRPRRRDLRPRRRAAGVASDGHLGPGPGVHGLAAARGLALPDPPARSRGRSRPRPTASCRASSAATSSRWAAR